MKFRMPFVRRRKLDAALAELHYLSMIRADLEAKLSLSESNRRKLNDENSDLKQRNTSLSDRLGRYVGLVLDVREMFDRI